ncbi:hypothetical protein FQA39_LY11274 [Lamprigera yunnana]|nr:hypothetical protein FQA39_LY11274 [Lamprigera yunnana]
MKQVRSIYLNNNVLYYLSILSGTVAFSGRTKYNWLPKILQTVLIIIHLLIIIKVTIVDIPHWDSMGSLRNSAVLLLFNKLYWYGYPFTTISALVIVSLFNKTSVGVWKETNRIDNVIKEMSLNRELREQNRRILYRTNFAILPYALHYVILNIYQPTWLNVLQNFTFSIISLSGKVQYYTFVSHIARRFTIFNDFLKKTTKKAFVTSKNYELGEKIVLVVDQHKLLVDLTRIVNKIYSFLLFSYICFDSVIVISHIYFLLHLTVGGSTLEQMKIVMYLILPNMFSAAFDLWILTSCSSVVCIEANATNAILHEITSGSQNTIPPSRILATTTNYLLIIIKVTIVDIPHWDSMGSLRNSAVLILFNKLYWYGYPFTTISALVIVSLFNKTSVGVWKETNRIDNVIKEMSLNRELREQNRRILYRTNFAILPYALHYVILNIYQPTWLNVLQNFTFSIISLSGKVQYYTFVSHIARRFTIFNDFLKKTTKKAFVTSKNYELGEKIVLVVDQHKLLVDLTRIVNKIYSFLLFSYICFDSVIVISHIYFLLHLTVGGSTLEQMKIVMYLILPNMFSAAFDLWILTSCSSVVCIEANATNAILHEITSGSQNTIPPSRIKQISFHLMNNKLTITALELFNVDFTMVYSILATTTNYLLIIIKVTIVDIPHWDSMGSLRNSAVLILFNKLYWYGYPFTTISALVIVSLFNKTSVGVWKETNRIDNVIKEMSLNRELREQNRRILYRTNFAILPYALHYVILNIYQPTWLNVLQNFTFSIISLSGKVQYYTFVSHIARRFTIFNDFLKKTTKKAFVTSKNYELGEKIVLVVDQHKLLVDLTRIVNKIYSFLLFSYICFDSVIVISHIYFLLHLTVGGSTLEQMKIVMYLILPNMFSAAFDLWILTSCSSVVCIEANATNAILHEITSGSQNTIPPSRIKQISFHLMNNKLSITALELFNVDFTMVYSILATTTNYLLIIIKVTIVDIPHWDSMGSLRNSAVLLLFNKLYWYGYPFTTISALVIVSLFNKTSVGVWKETNRIDNVIKEMSLNRELREQNRRILYRTNFAILPYVLHYVILNIYQPTWLNVLQNFTFSIISLSGKVQYYTFVSHIARRFTIFNDFLKKTTKKAFVTSKNYELGEKIVLVVDQHKLLVDLTRIVNKIYSFLLFSYICFDSVIVISHIYFLLHLTVGGSTLEQMKIVMYLILPNMFSAAFDLWILTSCSSVVCIEANATNAILHEITSGSQNTIPPSRIKQISFHLMNNKLTITALELFNVDFTMVYSILATTTNYLLIMLQFDLDSMKRSEKRIINVTQKF